MFYNIKIKSNNGEYSLESFDKDIIQREMDLYFASLYDASPEFRAQIKEIDISTKNYDTYLELQQLKNVRESIVPPQKIQNQTTPPQQIFENQPSPDVMHFTNSAQTAFNQAVQPAPSFNQPAEYQQNLNQNLNNQNFNPVPPQNQDFNNAIQQNSPVNMQNFQPEFANMNNAIEQQNQNYIQNTIQPQVAEIPQTQPSLPPQTQFLSNPNELVAPTNQTFMDQSQAALNEPQMPPASPVQPSIPAEQILQQPQPSIPAEQLAQQMQPQPTLQSEQTVQQLSPQMQTVESIVEQMPPQVQQTVPVQPVVQESPEQLQQPVLQPSENDFGSENNVNIIFNDPESPASGLQIPPNHPDINQFNEIMPDIQLEGVQNINIAPEQNIEQPQEQPLEQVPELQMPESIQVEQPSNIQPQTTDEVSDNSADVVQAESQQQDNIPAQTPPQTSLLNSVIASSDVLQQEINIEQTPEQQPQAMPETVDIVTPQVSEPAQNVKTVNTQPQPEEINQASSIVNEILNETVAEAVPAPSETVENNDYNLDNLKTDLFEKPKELKVIDYFETPKTQEPEITSQMMPQVEPYTQPTTPIGQFEQNIPSPTPIQQDTQSIQQDNPPTPPVAEDIPMPQPSSSSYFEDNMTQSILDEVKGRVDTLNLSNDEIDGDLLGVFEDDAPVIEFSRERIASVKKEYDSGVQIDEFGSKFENQYNIGASGQSATSSAASNETDNNDNAEGENIIDLNSMVKEENQPEQQPAPQPQTPPEPPAAPVDFKTYYANNSADLLVDKFLICAYYIKNILNQESFTLKFINSKLFTATGEIANMTTIEELLSKNLINAAQSDSAKQYVISSQGEEYFTNNLKHS